MLNRTVEFHRADIFCLKMLKYKYRSLASQVKIIKLPVITMICTHANDYLLHKGIV